MAKIEDLATATAETVNEVHRQAELCLMGTVQLATSSDQRATMLAGVFGAGSVALLAAVATILAAQAQNQAFLVSSIVGSVLLFCAALLCAFAARPTDFHVAGYEPKRLAKAAGDRTWMLRYATEDIQDRIDSNRDVLRRSALLTAIGTACALLAVIAGVATFLVIFFRVADRLF